jgi:hypothetical protein
VSSAISPKTGALASAAVIPSVELDAAGSHGGAVMVFS